MKALFILVCSVLLAVPAFAESRDEVMYAGFYKNGAWDGQLNLHFSIPTSVDTAQNFTKELICIRSENGEDERVIMPCIEWECRAFLSVPLKTVLSLQYGDDFTSPSYIDLFTLKFWIPQKDCKNPMLEVNESRFLHSETPFRYFKDVQTGSSSTTGDYSVGVTATLLRGSGHSPTQLTQFTFDNACARLVDPEVNLYENQGNLRRQNHFAQHLAPADPVYISKESYPEIRKDLPPPPTLNSAGQSFDEDTLLSLQASRTPEDCRRANSEVQINFDVFFGEPLGPLTKLEVEKVKPFMMKVDQDSFYFAEQLKHEFPRPRPYDYIKGLEPCVPKEQTLAYPSGHAAISALWAMVGADLFPEKAISLKQRADEIARDRVLGGVHHPSDIEAGKLVARSLYEKLQSSAKFQEDLRKVRSGQPDQGQVVLFR